MRSNLFWLSDEQWERIEPHLPTDVRGVERQDDRRVISGIVQVLKSGCRWCDCPPEYGPHTTIYNRFVRWARRGFCPRPDLILLDLNMPKMDGRELLAILKVDEDFKTIPVVILTTSNTEVDITKSYQLSANCYLSKPVRLDEFEALVKSISDFWLTKVSLPKTKTPLNTHAHDRLLGLGKPST